MQKPILIVKVGTSTLLDNNDEPSKTFDSVAESLINLRSKYRIALVTSGAIGFGVTKLKLSERPGDLASLQALSMIGQIGLIKRWRESLKGQTLGQVLVTKRDLERDKTAELFINSVNAVWRYGGLPVINENDAVSTDEISFGDNDRLASEVAVALGAEILIFLTDQDGIQADFSTPNQRRLGRVNLKDAKKHIIPTKSLVSRGGALSKIQSAQIALESNTQVYIAKASVSKSIETTLAGKSGTKIIQ